MDALADTCDDCPACRRPENWTRCCAACHCCPDNLRCNDCRPAPDTTQEQQR